MTNITVTESTDNGATAKTTYKFPLISAAEVMQKPPPPWLIGDNDTHGVVPAGQLTVLYGPPKEGKTFVALGMAFCVAAGLEWHGFEVKQGEVVYVVAEGGHGLGVRVEALHRHHEMEHPVDGLHFIEMPVQLVRPAEHVTLIEEIQAQSVNPALVVLDTLARCMVGADENTVKDMGTAIEHASQIQRALGAAVLLVHHSGKRGDIRGSTALLGAVDKVLSVEEVSKHPKKVKLTSENTKDGCDFDPMHFALQQIRLGPKKPSCVLVPTKAPAQDQKAKQGLPKRQRVFLAVLAAAGERGLTYTEIRERCAAGTPGRATISGTSVASARKDLLAMGKPAIAQVGAEDEGNARYVISAAGRELLGIT